MIYKKDQKVALTWPDRDGETIATVAEDFDPSANPYANFTVEGEDKVIAIHVASANIKVIEEGTQE